MKRLQLLLSLCLLSAACVPTPSEPIATETETPFSLDQIAIPPGFDFATQSGVTLRATVPLDHPARVSGGIEVAYESPQGPQALLRGELGTETTTEYLIPVPTQARSLQVSLEAGGQIETFSVPIIAGVADFRSHQATALRTTAGTLAELPTPPISPGREIGGPSLVPEDLGNYPITSVSFAPSEQGWGTLAFEDNWPSRGDYDFNDLVLSYRVVQYRNPGDRIVVMELFYRVEAVGAGFNNGLGLSLPIQSSKVHRVDGTHSQRNGSDGLEPGHSNAVIILADDVGELIPGSGLRNTRPGVTYQPGDIIRVVIHFKAAIGDRDLGTAPFNPFIFVDGDRSREVHLIDQPATALAQGFFGTKDDRGGYRTATGLPWAIQLPATWDWPLEKEPVNLGHLEFRTWAESGGSTAPDWYADKGNNRNRNRLFRKQ